jgi:hypothetical protein
MWYVTLVDAQRLVPAERSPRRHLSDRRERSVADPCVPNHRYVTGLGCADGAPSAPVPASTFGADAFAADWLSDGMDALCKVGVPERRARSRSVDDKAFVLRRQWERMVARVIMSTSRIAVRDHTRHRIVSPKGHLTLCVRSCAMMNRTQNRVGGRAMLVRWHPRRLTRWAAPERGGVGVPAVVMRRRDVRAVATQRSTVMVERLQTRRIVAKACGCARRARDGGGAHVCIVYGGRIVHASCHRQY